MVEYEAGDILNEKEIPNLQIQKDLILEKLKEPMIVGQTWYLLDAKWFKSFKNFVSIDTPDRPAFCLNPGPIDNSLLIDKSTKSLKQGLIELLDYVVIPASAWTLLSSWYGLRENQQPIGRQVINVARPPRVEPKVEIYKIELHLCNNPEFKDPHVHPFSPADKISKVEEVCRKVFKVPDHQQVVLRCYYGPNQSQVLSKDSTIIEESLDSNLKIVMDVVEEQPVELPKSFMKPELPKNKGRDPSRIPRPPTSRPLPGPGMMTRQHSSGLAHGTLGSCEGRGPPCTPGLSGLMNLGNTCFLNSIIQCLSNCGPITQYFLDGHHEKEINATNPLGNAGQIASSFADVISMIWSGRYSTTVPHYFKLQLTKFAPQFAGCQQHDAQELLTFLLDGLHEDLNRIKEKPYCQNEENDQEDDTLARLSWEYFLRRNDSIIIDHFHGMLKSRVVCPDCEKVSIKFDTFSTLSLPLPLRCDRPIMVRYVPYDQSLKIVDLYIMVPKKGTIQDMMIELSKITHVKPDHMIIAELNKSHFHKFFSRDDPLEHIDERDKIIMYDLPEYISEDKTQKYTILPCVMWEVFEPPRTIHFLSSLFGTPFLMVLPQGSMYVKSLYDGLCERLLRAAPGFMKANKNHGCFSMDCEPAEEPSTSKGRSANSYLFTPVLVNTHSYEDMQKIEGDEYEKFDVPDYFGRQLLAIQVLRQVRLELYKDPTPIYEDHTDGFRRSPIRPTLEDCLSLFTTTEKLGENNAWHCPRCNMKKRATKKLDLWKLPNILIIHLKRFAFNETRKEKLDIKVEFPLTDLNIDHYVVSKHKDNLVYDLIGVCNHYGSLMGGHYTAMCKSYKDGHWYCFDDNNVSPVSPESVQTESAYVLFYQRRPIVRSDPEEEKADL